MVYDATNTIDYDRLDNEVIVCMDKFMGYSSYYSSFYSYYSVTTDGSTMFIFKQHFGRMTEVPGINKEALPAGIG